MAKAKDKYEDLTKDEVIKKEKLRFGKCFAKVDPKVKNAAASLIEEAAFMSASLYDLRKIINEKGYVEEYQNGANQKGYKKSSEVEIYNSMIKNYNATIKQITDLIPKEERVGKIAEDDGFDDFLQGKNK